MDLRVGDVPYRPILSLQAFSNPVRLLVVFNCTMCEELQEYGCCKQWSFQCMLFVVEHHCEDFIYAHYKEDQLQIVILVNPKHVIVFQTTSFGQPKSSYGRLTMQHG